MTHSTAKWAWLRAAAGGGCCGFRADGAGCRGDVGVAEAGRLTALVRADAAALLGRRSASRSNSLAHPPPGTPGVAAARQWLTALGPATTSPWSAPASPGWGWPRSCHKPGRKPSVVEETEN
ncbi:MAG: hypothetical protein R2742_00980 [Micropruina glycogenica]